MSWSPIQGVLTGIYIFKINYESQHARVCNQSQLKEGEEEEEEKSSTNAVPQYVMFSPLDWSPHTEYNQFSYFVLLGYDPCSVVGRYQRFGEHTTLFPSLKVEAACRSKRWYPPTRTTRAVTQKITVRPGAHWDAGDTRRAGQGRAGRHSTKNKCGTQW
jgi:hypothetical protein